MKILIKSLGGGKIYFHNTGYRVHRSKFFVLCSKDNFVLIARHCYQVHKHHPLDGTYLVVRGLIH